MATRYKNNFFVGPDAEIGTFAPLGVSTAPLTRSGPGARWRSSDAGNQRVVILNALNQLEIVIA